MDLPHLTRSLRTPIWLFAFVISIFELGRIDGAKRSTRPWRKKQVTIEELESSNEDCPEPVSFSDNLMATHLYLIAQEAVHNAVKHAQAKNVRIALRTDGIFVLSIQDNGIGMPKPSSEVQGLGLRIMRNRAAILGAKLTIAPAEPHGTMVRCDLPR